VKTAFRRYVAAAVVAALLVPASAKAQFTTYLTLADYLAATMNGGVDSFDDLPADEVMSPLIRTAGPHNYTVAVSGGELPGFFPAGPGADRWLSPDDALATMVFTGFGSNVRGLGGFFFGSNQVGNFVAGTTITITAISATGTQSFSFVGTSTGTFFGILANSAWSALTVSSVQPPSGPARWASVNDFRAAEVVPEPSTYVLMATGLIGVVGLARRRRSR